MLYALVMKRQSTDLPFVVEARRLMQQENLTLRDLAAQADVDDGYLAHVLNGKKRASEDLVLRVSLALDLPADYFIEYRRAAVDEYLKHEPRIVNRLYYGDVRGRLRGSAES